MDYKKDLTLYELYESKQLLSKEEEITLAEKIKGGDIAARNHLIESNIGLVRHIVNTKYSQFKNKNDLIQTGIEGLFSAAERFDPIKFNTKFSTYSTWWIRQHINRSLYTDRLIKIPVHNIQKLDNYQKVIKYEISLGNEKLDYDGIARALPLKNGEPISIEAVKELEKIDHNLKVLSLNNSYDSSEITIEDKLESNYPNPEEISIENEKSIFVSKILSYLDKKEKIIIGMRFGFGEYIDGHTLEEIGQEIGLSRERVRQIEFKALEKLKRKIKDFKKEYS